LYFFFNLWKKADKNEREPIAALLAIFGVVIIFWAVFHQNGSALTYWAKCNTDRKLSKVGTAILSPINNIDEVSTVPRMVEKVDLHGIPLGKMLGPSYYFDNYKKQFPKGNLKGKPLDIGQNEWDKFNDDEKVLFGGKPKDIKIADWKNIPIDERENHGKITVWPTELQASINPGWIIVLTFPMVIFWGFLRRRGREPSTPGKITWGMFISALAWVVMVFAAYASGNGAAKASVLWLFGIYGVITIGELCLSPMGLSIVSKLAPKRFAALLMGGWFLSTAIGNKLSGVLSGLWDLFEKKANFFWLNAGLTFGAFLVIFAILPWLRRIYKENI